MRVQDEEYTRCARCKPGKFKAISPDRIRSQRLSGATRRAAIEDVIADLGRFDHRIRPVGTDRLCVIEQRATGERGFHFATKNTAGERVRLIPGLDIDLAQRRTVVDERELIRLVDDIADRVGVILAALALEDNVGDRKLASIGVHISRGVSAHGFAVNVTNDLAPFTWVVACGLPSVSMTSLALEGSPDDLPCFRKRMAFTFARTFGRRQRLVTPRRLGIGTPQPVGTLDP